MVALYMNHSMLPIYFTVALYQDKKPWLSTFPPPCFTVFIFYLRSKLSFEGRRSFPLPSNPILVWSYYHKLLFAHILKDNLHVFVQILVLCDDSFLILMVSVNFKLIFMFASGILQYYKLENFINKWMPLYQKAY